jgi:hypothetical protein
LDHGLALTDRGTTPILQQLLDKTVLAGSSTQLRIDVAGTQPITYQWQFNGEDLADGTNSALTLSGVDLQQSGTYSVQVRNKFGTAVSSALLTVKPLEITVQPEDQVAFVGGSGTFSAESRGAPPLSYQWLLNGIPLAGLDAAVLSITNVQLAQAGHYSLLISNRYGQVASASARLGVGEVAGWGALKQNVVAPDLTNIQAVALGHGHGVALRRTGEVIAWGSNDHGQTNIPVGVTNVSGIGSGFAHSLAVVNGHVVAWGETNAGQCQVPGDLTNVLQVAGGQDYSVALTSDGRIVTWGTGTAASAPGISNAVSIAAGWYHGLALLTDGSVTAWGENFLQQASVPTGLKAVAIAAGSYFSMALLPDGTVITWSPAATVSMPVPSNLSNVVAIAAGWTHCLALKADGRVIAWEQGKPIADWTQISDSPLCLRLCRPVKPSPPRDTTAWRWLESGPRCGY